jgi:hypothetical protein
MTVVVDFRLRVSGQTTKTAKAERATAPLRKTLDTPHDRIRVRSYDWQCCAINVTGNDGDEASEPTSKITAREPTCVAKFVINKVDVTKMIGVLDMQSPHGNM